MAELGESGNPKDLVPGEPREIRKSTEHLVTYGADVLRIGDGLKRLDTGGWTGAAADKFHEFFDGEPARWVSCGEAFHSAAEAINGYAGTLEWAQGEAARAIQMWDRGQRATQQARAQYDQAAQQAAADGTPEGEVPSFQDPGQAGRDEAQRVLDAARSQLVSAGDRAVAVVDRAQESAPAEPTLFGEIAEAIGDIPGNVAHYGMTVAADVVDFATNTAGAVTEGAGWLAGRVVDGAGNVAGAVLDGVGLDGHAVEQATDSAADTVTSSTHTAGDAAWKWGDERAADIRGAADDVAESLGAEDPPSHTEPVDLEADSPDYVIVDEDRYPESAEHVKDAQSGLIWRGDEAQEGRKPLPSEVTFDPADAASRRRESLGDIPSRGAENLDRDEYPPAMMREGGAGSSVQYIDSSDNRGSGSSMRHQIGAQKLEAGDKVHIVAG
ncbi:hypothetical protein GCM10022222_51290 [Amycolatopsis ultiminotia]|uniref:Uncharacterized protein n=1 Tax=Amycolatopsis ultiminotia TaxID=543629 RepID=A0ABP6X4C0_9PSEU